MANTDKLLATKEHCADLIDAVLNVIAGLPMTVEIDLGLGHGSVLIEYMFAGPDPEDTKHIRVMADPWSDRHPYQIERAVNSPLTGIYHLNGKQHYTAAEMPTAVREFCDWLMTRNLSS